MKDCSNQGKCGNEISDSTGYVHDVFDRVGHGGCRCILREPNAGYPWFELIRVVCAAHASFIFVCVDDIEFVPRECKWEWELPICREE